MTPTPKTARWKSVLVGAGLVAVFVVCILAVTRDKRPGSPDVYTRIDGLTSCSALQSEFDTASAAHARDTARGRTDLAEIDSSYMDAADDRMKEIGCYR